MHQAIGTAIGSCTGTAGTLVAALRGELQEQTMDLIAGAYETISVKKATDLLGLSEGETSERELLFCYSVVATLSCVTLSQTPATSEHDTIVDFLPSFLCQGAQRLAGCSKKACSLRSGQRKRWLRVLRWRI